MDSYLSSERGSMDADLVGAQRNTVSSMAKVDVIFTGGTVAMRRRQGVLTPVEGTIEVIAAKTQESAQFGPDKVSIRFKYPFGPAGIDSSEIDFVKLTKIA